MIVPDDEDIYARQAVAVEKRIVGMGSDVAHIIHLGSPADERVQGDAENGILKPGIERFAMRGAPSLLHAGEENRS